MINQQLVDYIKQQMQAGVAKDVIRKTLVDAGWPAADLDESMKAGEAAVAAVGVNPAAAMGGASTVTASTETKKDSENKFFSRPATATAAIAATGNEDDADHPSTKKFMTAMIAMGAVILLLAGALAFVYFNLNGQLETATQSDDSSKVASLQGQITQLGSEKNELVSQVSTLTNMNNELSAELTFLVAPAVNATSSVTSTVRGKLYSLSTIPGYLLITDNNVRVYISNYRDAKVSAILNPLANGTSTVQLSGTHAPASANLTVTAVNGTAL